MPASAEVDFRTSQDSGQSMSLPALSPSLLDTTENLAQVWNQLFNVTQFISAIKNVEVGALSPKPDWLTDVKDMVNHGGSLATDWLKDMPDIASPFSSTLISYASTFQALAQDPPSGKKDWLEILKALHQELGDNGNKVSQGLSLLNQHQKKMALFHYNFREKLQEVRAAYEQEQVELAEIEVHITNILDRIEQLSGQLVSSDLSAGKSLFQTMVKVVMPIIREVGESVPYISIGIAILSVGKIHLRYCCNR